MKAIHILALALICAIPSAKAVTIVSDNFDQDTSGATLTSSTASGLTIGTIGTGNSITTSTTAQSSLSAGVNGLLITDNDSVSATPSFSYAFAAQTNTKLVLSFDLNLVDSSLQSTYQIDLKNGSSLVTRIYLDRTTVGQVFALNGAAPVSLGTLTVGTWYHIELTVDLQTEKYSVALLGGTQYTTLTTVLSNLSFNTATHSVTQIYGSDGAGGAGGSLYLDNISLDAVPEPNTWAMIIGGMGVLVCSRRFCRDMA